MEKNIVLIMGGDGKIAQAVVRKYLDEDNTIVIAVDRGEHNKDASFNQRDNYEYYSCDLTSVEQLNDLFNKINEKYGYVTHIISMAAKTFPGDTDDISELKLEEVDEAIKINLNSHIYITKIYTPLIQKCNSANKSILYFSSLNAIKSYGNPAYSASKAGLIGFVNALVRKMGKERIRVNTICPGTVAGKEEVEMGEQFWGYVWKNQMALDSYTSPEDIANACYSITNIATAITGQNIVVDSGQSR